MRYKQHTISKLDARVSKLKTLQRMIEMRALSVPEAMKMVDGIIKDITLVIERLDLEPNE